MGPWADYHRSLVEHMTKAKELSRQAAARDQARRERYYNQRVRRNSRFKTGDLVWILKPPRGKGTTKLVHRWVGPARVERDAGYDNWSVERLDNGEHLITHVSFMTSYHCPESQKEAILQQALEDFETDEHTGVPDVWGHELEAEDMTAAASGPEAVRPASGAAMEQNGSLQGQQPATEQSAPNTGSVPENTDGGDVAGTASAPRRVIRTTGGIERGSGSTVGSATVAGNSAAARSHVIEVAHSDDGENSTAQPATVINRAQKRKAATSVGPPVQKRRRLVDRGPSPQELQDARRRQEAARTAREDRAAKRSALRDQKTSTEAKTEDSDEDVGLPEARASMQRASREDGNRDNRDAEGGDQGAPGNTKPPASVQALRSQGRPRKRGRLQGLRELPIVGKITERGRRRQRNRAGRYELQYLVEYRTEEHGPVQQQWLGIAEFQALLDARKLEDELEGDGE